MTEPVLYPTRTRASFGGTHEKHGHSHRNFRPLTKLKLELELELIQTRMIQKPLPWVEVGKSACVLVGICELRLSLPARYDPQCLLLFDFLSGCLVRVLWTCQSSTDTARASDEQRRGSWEEREQARCT